MYLNSSLQREESIFKNVIIPKNPATDSAQGVTFKIVGWSKALSRNMWLKAPWPRTQTWRDSGERTTHQTPPNGTRYTAGDLIHQVFVPKMLNLKLITPKDTTSDL